MAVDMLSGVSGVALNSMTAKLLLSAAP